MIYITGDTHGERMRFSDLRKYSEMTWNENDILIICGDFGYVFLDDLRERKFLDDLEARPYTICFCDGNHENFPAIYSYPCEMWNGGRVHRIRNNIYHLMRGQTYEIDGKSFFVMGGGYSRDKASRVEGLTWWREELPNNDEYREANASIKKYNRRFDYIISHTAPLKIIVAAGKMPDPHESELCGFFEWMRENVEYKAWFFGHFHVDKQIDERHRALWFDVVSIEGTE